MASARIKGVQRRDRAIHAGAERLESRRLLSELARLDGVFQPGRRVATVDVAVTAADFQLPRGRVLLDVTAGPGVQVTPALPWSRLGTNRLVVTRPLGGPASFQVDVGLAGDVGSDGAVTAADLAVIRSRFGARAGRSTYLAAADVNHDGRIGWADAYLARLNLGVVSRLRPLAVTAGASVQDDPDGDGEVARPTVTLSGRTNPGALVTLDRNGDGSVDARARADAAGRYTFAVTLTPEHATNLIVAASDVFGQRSTARVVLTYRPRGDSAPPVVAVDGPSGVRTVNAALEVSGRVGDVGSGVARLEARLDGGPPVSVAFDRATGAFRYSSPPPGPGLVDGPHAVSLQAFDGSGNASAVVTVAFLTDTTSPRLPSLTLAPETDTPPAGDNRTTSGTVSLLGTTDPGARVELTGRGLAVTAGSDGAFRFDGVSLAFGPNAFTARALDAAGNASTAFLTVTRVADDPVLAWDRIATQAIQADGTTPPVASRGLAMVSLAMYDAVAAVNGTPAFAVAVAAPAGASAEAAASAAARDVLAYLYPAQTATFDAALVDALAAVPDGPAETAGAAVGRAAAAAIVRLRAQDGSAVTVTDSGGSATGVWRPTGPMYATALLPQWAGLTPFALTSPDQFRPPGPPTLDSPEYAAALNEVQALGAATGSSRTSEQTQIARFWADGAGTDTPPGHWNRIATGVARGAGLDLAANARLFAALNVALADAGIAAWDVKYADDFWRPVTAVQQADADGNPATSADPSWSSFLITPPFPEYVSGHSTFSAAAAEVLASTFGDVAFTTDSIGLPGVSRSFGGFRAAAAEAGRSRIYGGIHFEFSNQDGQALGRSIAGVVLSAFSTADDTRPPTVSVDAPSRGVSVSTPPTVSGVVLDGRSGVALLEAQVDGGAFAPVGFDALGAFTFTPGPLADGAHAVRLRATDRAGNVSNPVVVAFTVDTAAPTVSLEGPAAGAAVAAGARLTGAADGTGSPLVALSYRVGDGPTVPLEFDALTGAFDAALDLSRLSPGEHVLTVTARDAAGLEHSVTSSFRLDAAVPLAVAALTPPAGADGVGATVRPRIDFTRPIDPGTVTTANFYATGPTGAALPARVVPSADGAFAWLFFDGPMPGDSLITLTVDGSTIRASDGSLLDADGDGSPGGVLTRTFTTVSLTPLPGTSLVGRVVDPGPDLDPMTFDDTRAGADGILHTADDVFLRPLAGVKVTIIGLEGQAVTTAADGTFRFDAVPAGTVKLAVDGRTAKNAPAGVYFPEMVMDLEVVATQTNTVMGSMGTTERRLANLDRGEVYLPRIATSVLKPVSTSQVTTVGVDGVSAPDLTPEQRASLSIDVAPGSLVDDQGRPLASGQVGISTVPADLVRDMLPPGLIQHTFDITVQAPGVATFTTPAAMTFPNVFGAAPGTKLNFLSFDHTTGRLVIEGTGTVSADGLSVRTDPGTGITHPGWHGMTPPGTPGGGGPWPDDDDNDDDNDGCPPPPPGESDEEFEAPPGFGYIGADGNVSGALASFQATRTLRGAREPQAGEVFRFVWERPPLPDPSKCMPDDPTTYEIEFTLTGDLPRWTEFADDNNVPLRFSGQTLRRTLSPTSPETRLVFAVRTIPNEDLASYLGGTEEFPYANLNDNLLLGSRIKIKEVTKLGNGRRETITGESTVYRLIDAADDDHTDGVLSFEKTVPGAERGKRLSLEKMDPKVRPAGITGSGEFSYTDPNIVFKPGDGDDHTGRLTITSPTGSVLTVPLEGKTVEKTQIYVNVGALAGALTDLYNQPVSPLSAAERSFFESLNSATGVREFSPSAVASIAAAAADTVRSVYSPFASSIEVVTSAAELTSGNVVRADDFVYDAGDPPPVAAVGTLVVGGNSHDDGGDIDRDKVGEILRNESNWSDAERLYRLSDAVNSQLSDEVYAYVGRLFFNWRISWLNPYWPGDLTRGGIIKGIAKTIAHEAGHTLGLLHTLQGDKGFDPTDIMAQKVIDLMQGVESQAFHEMSRGAALVATGGSWTYEDQGKQALLFYRNAFASGSALTFDGSPVPGEDTVPISLGAGRLDTWNASGTAPVTGIDFGTQPAGGRFEQTIQVRNGGDRPLRLRSARVEGGDGQFLLTGIGNVGVTVAPGASLNVTVAFVPTAPGSHDARIVFVGDGLKGTVTLPLTGESQAAGPAAVLDLSRNALGGAVVGRAPSENGGLVTLVSRGDVPLTITGVRLLGDNPAFELVGVPADLATNPVSLEFGSSFTFGARFTPSAPGLQRAQVEVTTNDPARTVLRFHLAATGTTVRPVARIGNDHFSIGPADDPDNPTVRLKTDAGGNFSIFVPSLSPYLMRAFDPETGLIGYGFGTSGTPDRPFNPALTASFAASNAPDSDGDGLPDDVELAVGSSRFNADTNGDGVDDYTAVMNGVDPILGKGFPFGVTGGAALTGTAVDVTPIASTAQPDRALALVATGAGGGVSVVDVTRPDRPAEVGRLALPGTNARVAYEPGLKFGVVAAGDAGIHLIDLSDPTRPTLAATIPVTGGASAVNAFAGRALVASGRQLRVIDLATRTELTALGVADQPITDLARVGTTLYVTSADNVLTAVDLAPAAPLIRGSIPVPNTGGRVTAVGSTVYAQSTLLTFGNQLGGYNTIDASDPTRLRLVSGPDNQPGVGLAGTALAATGGPSVVLVGIPQNQPALDVMNASDADQTNAFVRRVPLPEAPFAVAVSGTTALVAAGAGGLRVVSVLPPDVDGVTPTITLGDLVNDADAVTPGTQVDGGSLLTVVANARDDVQVARVEWWVDDMPAAVSTSYPFEFGMTASLVAADTPLTIQARAVDTGGNARSSNTLTYTVRPVLVHVVATSPAPGATLSGSPASLSVTFDRRIDPASTSPSDLHLIAAGPDRAFDTADDVPVAITTVGLDPTGRVLTLTPASPLGAGQYRLTIPASKIRDTAGNTLDGEYPGGFPTGDGQAGGDFVSDFKVTSNVTLSESAFPLRKWPTVVVGPKQYVALDTNQPDQGAGRPTLADLDGDGRLDLIRPVFGRVVTVNDDGTSTTVPLRQVVVRLGQAGGTFGDPAGYGVGDLPRRVVAADVNGDGKLDLVSVNVGAYSSTGQLVPLTFSVLLGNGDGTFQAERRFDPGRTVRYLFNLPIDPGAVVGDFDGDGKADLAVLTTTARANATPLLQSVTGDLLVFPGDGSGGFAAAPGVTTLTARSSYPWSREVFAADLNGDGKLDVVTPEHVLINRGGAAFDAALAEVADEGARVVAVADFDRDGRRDLLVARGPDLGAPLVLYRVDGNGTVSRGPSSASGGGGLQPLFGATADLNGDGKLDFIGQENGIVFSYLGNGDGSFAAPRVVRNLPNLQVTNSAILGLAAGDVTGDGLADVVTGYTADNSATVARGNGDGTFDTATGPTGTANLQVFIAPQVLDLNLDGKPDLFGYYNDPQTGPTLTAALGNGDGTFRRLFGIAGAPQFPTLGDLNADGKPDLLGLRSNAGAVDLVFRPGNGDGTFGAESVLQAGFATGSPLGLSVADTDGDGKADVVAFLTTGISAFPRTAPGVVGTPRTTAWSVNVAQQPAVVGDFNGDGREDLAFVQDTPTAARVLVFVAQADGSLAQAGILEPTVSRGARLALGDFNADGFADVALTTAGSNGSLHPNRLGVYLGRGDGTFRAPVFVATEGSYSDLRAADVNGDGITDLTFGGVGEYVILLCNGDGTFQSPRRSAVSGPVAGFNTSVLVGSFNASEDGLVDLIVYGIGFRQRA